MRALEGAWHPTLSSGGIGRCQLNHSRRRILCGKRVHTLLIGRAAENISRRTFKNASQSRATTTRRQGRVRTAPAKSAQLVTGSACVVAAYQLLGAGHSPGATRSGLARPAWPGVALLVHAGPQSKLLPS